MISKYLFYSFFIITIILDVSPKLTPSTPYSSDDETRPHIRRSQSSPPTTKANPRSTLPSLATKSRKQDSMGLSKKQKKVKTVTVLDESGDDEEDVAFLKRAKKLGWKKKGPLTMADSFLEQARIDDTRTRELAQEERAERQQRFKAEQKQRDQHHEVEMARQQAILNQGEIMILQARERLLHMERGMHKTSNAQNFDQSE